MKKRCLLLGVLFVFIISTGITAAGFRDVKTSDWHYEAVTKLTNEGIASGYGNGTFLPNNQIKRSEFVTLLAKASKEDYSANTSSFSDVKVGDWFYPQVSWAVKTGIVAGKGNNLFMPEAKISREEMITMLYRYLVYKGVSLPATAEMYYSDTKAISGYAQEPVGKIYNFGGVNGMGNNKFAPKGIATRAQACQILFNNLYRNNRQRCALFAQNFIGWNYKEGGKHPNTGFDSAGFVTYLYGHFGIPISGDVIALRQVGTEVPRSGVNMGDLVCFGANGTTPIVGIYLGNNRFATAMLAKNTGGSVYTANYASDYYKNSFVTARRMFSY